MPGDGLVERDLAGVNERHRAGGDDGLAHALQPEDGVLRHGLLRFDVLPAGVNGGGSLTVQGPFGRRTILRHDEGPSRDRLLIENADAAVGGLYQLQDLLGGVRQAAFDRLFHVEFQGDLDADKLIQTALAEGFDESLAPDDLFAVAHAMRPALIGASGARARGAFARGVVSRAAEPGIAGLAFCDEQFLGACIDLARAMRQSPAFTVALVRALPGAYEPWREAHVVSAVLEELRTALPPATISALGQALLALPAAPTPEMDRKRSLALYATGHTPALGRFVTRASAEAGYWDAHPDMLRYVAENLLQVSYEDAAGMLVTLVGHIPRGPSLGMLDRVLAGRLEMPGGIGEDRRERKAFGKVLSKQGITADALPETFRVLTGERDGGSVDPDTRGRGRDR